MTAISNPPVQQLSPDESDVAVQWRKLLGGLSGKIEPVPVGIMYRLGLLLVAATMIVLPIIYIALIALAGYGVYWYAINATGMFRAARGRAAIIVLVAYLGPLVAGAILVFFMIKPLFARRQVTFHPLSVSRGEQPLLFAFVERLCEVVGAPKPSRIDVDTNVNASASFREGWWGFIKKDLVLTIGLPLVAGMDLRMLTGVLAHEFGHFAQGTGMRLTYLIRSINGWFYRVVYERDSWDAWLVNAQHTSEHWAISIIVALSRLFVWTTRRILWLLMVIGHGVSSFALRQMEFDADRYEARVSGSDTFVKTAERLELLQVAAHAAMNELESAWREKRLCDDLPTFIQSREADLPAELRNALAKHNAQSKTGWFDTHPANADRNQSARREAATGIFTIDAPATALFRNYDDLARRATVAFYHEALGGQVRPENLVATCTLVEARGKKKQSYQALRRYCQDLVHPVRPVYPMGGDVPKDPDICAERLLELRGKLSDVLPRAKAASEQYEKADDRMIAVARARVLRAAGERVDIKELDFKRGDESELQATITAAAQNKRAAELVLNEVLADAMLRMQIALSLEPKAETDKAQAATEPADEYDIADAPAAGSNDLLRDALTALGSSAQTAESLRQNFYLLGTLGPRLRDEGNSETLIEEVLARSKYVCQDLAHIHGALRRTPYPYEHHDRNATLTGFVVPLIPTPENIGDVYHAAEQALDSIYSLYMRIMSDLAQRAENIESDLGLPPLPEPPEKTEEEAAANK
jgi:Zn-dependent protease with chaperone function